MMPIRQISRRAVLSLPILAGAAQILAACSSTPAPIPQVFTPLHYEYLTPLRLRVASIAIQNNWQPTSAADVGALSPAPPAAALVQMAQDRLQAVGPGAAKGSAVFNVDDAAIIRNGDTLSGTLAVHLDIISADGTRSGYAEARVVRTNTLVGDPPDLRGGLYDITKQMMDDMNVEFEFQVRKSLHDWLDVALPPAPGNAPVQAQPLPPPPTDGLLPPALLVPPQPMP